MNTPKKQLIQQAGDFPKNNEKCFYEKSKLFDYKTNAMMPILVLTQARNVLSWPCDP